MKKTTPGERIKSRRTELNYTQRDLAKRAGVSHVAISKWESDDNEPAGRNLFQLSKALRCSPTWLLYGDEGHEPTSVEELPEQIELSGIEQELLDLFRALPESEKIPHVDSLRSRVDDLNRLFYELLQARKSNKKK